MKTFFSGVAPHSIFPGNIMQVHIPQPSLTNAIRELEKEMHVTIFERTNKGVMISCQ